MHSIIIDIGFVIMAIINYVFIFHNYWPNFYHTNFSDWLYFVFWGGIYFVPIINEITTIFETIALYNLISLVSFATWIWGWIIIGSNSWAGIWLNYRDLANLLIAYQIIWIFFNINIQIVKKRSNKLSDASINVFRTTNKNTLSQTANFTNPPVYVAINVSREQTSIA
jgi:hypothetical protein